MYSSRVWRLLLSSRGRKNSIVFLRPRQVWRIFLHRYCWHISISKRRHSCCSSQHTGLKMRQLFFDRMVGDHSCHWFRCLCFEGDLRIQGRCNLLSLTNRPFSSVLMDIMSSGNDLFANSSHVRSCLGCRFLFLELETVDILSFVRVNIWLVIRLYWDRADAALNDSVAVTANVRILNHWGAIKSNLVHRLRVDLLQPPRREFLVRERV